MCITSIFISYYLKFNYSQYAIQKKYESANSRFQPGEGSSSEIDGSFAALVAGGGAALELIKPDIWPFSSLARVKLRCQPKIIFHHKHVSVTNSSFEKNLPILDTGVQLSYQDDKGVPKYSILLR